MYSSELYHFVNEEFSPSRFRSPLHANRGVQTRDAVYDGEFYFSPLGKGLGKSIRRERPQLRPEFRGATDTVEAAHDLRAYYVHELHKLHEHEPDCRVPWFAESQRDEATTF